MTSSTSRPGRPRDPQADQAILAAARDLLAEGGLHGLTVEGTAARAGVAKTTVYRRYSSKLDLAVAAIAALIQSGGPAENASDIAPSAVDLFQQTLGSPGNQAALMAVASAAATDSEVHERFRQSVIEPVLGQITDSFQDASSRGLISPDTPSDFCYDAIVGTLMHRLVIRQEPVDERFEDQMSRLVAFLLSGLNAQHP